MDDVELEAEDLIDEFLKNCANLKSLSISQNGTLWVKKFGRQLETLEVIVAPPLDFHLYTTAIREVAFNRISNPTVDCQDLWEKIGSSLPLDEIFKIKQHCRSLTTVILCPLERECIAAVASLLALYGDKLQYALLSGKNEGELKDVADAFPNPQFEFPGFTSVPMLQIIDPQLEILKNHGYSWLPGSDLEEWKNVWDKSYPLELRK